MDTPAQEPQESAFAEEGSKKYRFVTAGERIHKWATYLSVDWVFNATMGALLAYWGKFTDSGQKLWSNPINNVLNFCLKPCFKNPNYFKEAVKQGNTFISIIAGGMLTIPPLLVLENVNVKKSLIKSIDRLIYGKAAVDNDPAFKQAYAEIQEAPKKGFWTGMGSRFAALAPLLALVIITPTKDFLVKRLFGPVGEKTKKIVSGIGLTENRLFGKFGAAGAAERWKYIHEEALAMDLSFGLPYAVLHSITYNLFSKIKFGKHKDKEADKSIQSPASSPIEIADIETRPATQFAAKAAKIPSHASPQETYAQTVAARRNEMQTAPAAAM